MSRWIRHHLRHAALAAAALPAVLAAQTKDSTTAARAKRDSLETVVVRALRPTLAAPAAQTILSRADITRTFAGQDAPLAILSAPSMTAYSDAGGFSGYSYVRLRGVDQTRLNITLDGVPLNDPEDQVLYFSNVPDLLNSVQSVQIQRGVGSSSFGTASYGGSMNFQSIPLATTPPGGEVSLTGGSFNTLRATAQVASGVNGSGWAGYARVSKQHTDGYRDHSGNDSQSLFASGGWFGTNDAVKFTGFAGVSGTREAYLAASEDELKIDRRVNPLSEAEGDRFHQEMASLQYSHAFSDGVRLTATGYRNSAAGAFDVDFGGGTFANFSLAHVWYGAMSALSVRAGDLSVDVGAHVSDYHREHAEAIRPNLTQRDYTNVGFKQEQSGFAKVALDRGAWRWSADVQLRRAAFRYRPSSGAGISGADIDWLFLNPKVGVTYRRSDALTLYASIGHTSREPSRDDMFVGADDVNRDNVASIYPLDRVRPESVTDYELGAHWTSGAFVVSANLFAMAFSNEIARIGALSLTGSQLRRNVGASYRRGVEIEGTWRVSPRVSAGANLTVMQARIRSFTDEKTQRTYTDVEPVQTPPIISNQHLDVVLSSAWTLLLTTRYVDRGRLTNTGDAQLISPSHFLADGALAWRRGRAEVKVQLQNLLDADAYSGGYASGGVRYWYPVASRNVLVTTTWRF
jgi:iron complex outermembrane receptor protein